MPIDPSVAIGAGLPPVSFTWTEDDVLLYHLAVGAGARKTDEHELRYATEGHPGVLPTFAAVAATFHASEPPKVSFPGVDIDLAAVVHGSQSITVHGPIPRSGSAVTTTQITDVLDKGSAAIVVQESVTVSPAGEALWTARSSIFTRGEGGFGGHRGTSTQAWTADREPDRVVEIPTSTQQALLYRLCGDRNPLHSDPAFAARAGYDAPILHGLCTYAMVCKAVADTFAQSDPAVVSSFEAKFAGIVFPGETLRARLWLDGNDVHGHVTCVERGDAPVLTGVLARLTD